MEAWVRRLVIVEDDALMRSLLTQLLGESTRRLVATEGHAVWVAASQPGRPAAGWLGVDMILGDRSDGGDDRVLEVNPRVTTSFVGLSAVTPASLVRAIVAVAEGDAFDPGPLSAGCRFTLSDARPLSGP